MSGKNEEEKIVTTNVQTKKYLVCRPTSGLVDNLAVITLCLEYAIREKRTIVFDTTHACGFRDSFCHYFELRDNTKNSDIILSLSPELTQQLNATYIYPYELNLNKTGRRVRKKFPRLYHRFHWLIGRVWKNKNPLDPHFVWSNERKCVVDKETLTPLRYSLNESYTAKTLLYCGSGGFRGGLRSLEHFKSIRILATHLRFSPKLTAAIKKAIAPYQNTPYSAVHVRHTDYQSSYQQYFNQIRSQVAGKRLLVCSDSRKVLSFAKDYFTDSDVFNTGSYASPTADEPIHYYKETIAKKLDKSIFDLNTEAFIDLYALSGAENLFAAPLNNGHGGATIGHYSKMAMYLQQNQDLRARFLS